MIAPAEKMVRYTDWAARLERYVWGLKGREFRYGHLDCALFVCDAIEAMTGTNPAAEFKGRYSTREEGRKLLAAAGGFEGVAEAYGMPKVPHLRAGRGDVLLMRRSTLGLVSLNGRDALVLTDNGVELVSRMDAIGAWHV